jgi:hypothetical protein
MERGETRRGHDAGQELHDRRQELEDLSRDALIKHILRLEGLLPKDDTSNFRRPLALRPFDYPWEPKEYIRLPNSDEVGQTDGQPLLRVMLVSFDLAHPIIGIEVYGDIVIGRGGSEVPVDFDLTLYDATGYGVSRRQAMLRPTDGALQLIDLDSTNGTRLNGMQLVSREPYSLKHNDTIEFGGLQFQIKFVEDSD